VVVKPPKAVKLPTPKAHKKGKAVKKDFMEFNKGNVKNNALTFGRSHAPPL
jgi:hypothetical protein